MRPPPLGSFDLRLRASADSRRGRLVGRVRQRQLDVLGKVGVGQPQHAAAREIVERLRDAVNVRAQIDRCPERPARGQHAQQRLPEDADRAAIDRSVRRRTGVGWRRQ